MDVFDGNYQEYEADKKSAWAKKVRSPAHALQGAQVSAPTPAGQVGLQPKTSLSLTYHVPGSARSENRLPRLRCQCGARGEPLMGKLVEVTRNALTQEESSVRNIQQRNNLSDALNALKQHEAALLKGYPMALLEIFAEGPANAKVRPADASGMDFGELSLMDDSEVQDQVELARAQQLAAHATEGVLSELNTLVSSAGLAQRAARAQPLASRKLHPCIAAGCV